MIDDASIWRDNAVIWLSHFWAALPWFIVGWFFVDGFNRWMNKDD